MKLSQLIHSVLCTLFIAIAPALSAKHLSPDQALQKYKSHAPHQAPSPTATYNLAFTQMAPQSAQAGVYVFSRGNAGYVVLSADDAMPIDVLGYSNTGVFNADNMPEQMRWLLQCYAYCVESYAQTPEAKQAPLRDKKNTIAPICHTQWGQDKPYNDQCPTFNDGKAVTGCVATAMAQVMKVHQWPLQGTGFHQYNYEYNGQMYSESLDFSEITFDWCNMCDRYNNANTQAEKDAVATLMHSCGVAADMMYSPTGSGAYTRSAAFGWTEHLGYDKGMRLFNREWFTNSEWVDLLYNEIAVGRPVFFTGADIDLNGHAFVIDGYNDTYFHVNWGWDGIYDGYFDIFYLYPAGQGTGGGSGESGFDYYQDILTNIKPDEGTPDYIGLMVWQNEFVTSKLKYSVDESITFNGICYSLAIGPATYEVGLKLVADDGTEQYIPVLGDIYLEPYYGFEDFDIDASLLPAGNYKVYPAFKTTNSDWQIMYYDKHQTFGYLNFTVTDEMISIELPPIEQGEISATLNCVYPVNGTDDMLYIDHEYIFDWTLTTTGAWSGKIYCVLLDSEINDVVSWSDGKNYSTLIDTSNKMQFPMRIDSTLEPGIYPICLLEEREDAFYIIPESIIEVEIYITDTPDGKAKVTNVTFIGSDQPGTSLEDYATIDEANQQINVTFKCTVAPWEKNVRLAFCEVNTIYVIDDTELQQISLNEVGEEKTLSFCGPWQIDNDEIYMMAITDQYYNVIGDFYYFKINSYIDNVMALSMHFAGERYVNDTMYDPAILPEDEQIIEFDLICDKAPYNQNIALRFDDAFSNNPPVFSQYQEVNLTSSGKLYQVRFEGPWAGLNTNTVYKMRVVNESGKTIRYSDHYVKIIPNTGIFDITNDKNDEIEYYTPQGIKVKSPGQGVYIIKQGDKVTKILR